MNTKSESTYTCPWWLLFTFDNPLRKLGHNPQKMLAPYVHRGDTVLDVGCGMGYFSLGLAELVGEQGKVISADIQEEMLAGLVKRVRKAGFQNRVAPHLSLPDKIGVTESVDFALAFWMVHEVSNRPAFLAEIYSLIKPGGGFLVVEPRLHVAGDNFERTMALCEQLGFKKVNSPKVAISRAIYLQK
jgi:ubiquinone/menaquinone biosynthesis C-methylase UbiE